VPVGQGVVTSEVEGLGRSIRSRVMIGMYEAGGWEQMVGNGGGDGGGDGRKCAAPSLSPRGTPANWGDERMGMSHDTPMP
jgi:hypothetical protein